MEDKKTSDIAVTDDISLEVASLVNKDLEPFIREMIQVSRRGLVTRGGKTLGSIALLTSPLLNQACKPRGDYSATRDAGSDRASDLRARFDQLQKVDLPTIVTKGATFTDLINLVSNDPILGIPAPILQKIGEALQTKDMATFNALKAGYAVPHGKAIAVVIGGFLKLNPYQMFKEIRALGVGKSKTVNSAGMIVPNFNKDDAGLFVPLFGPAVIAKNTYVREALLNHQEIHVPYGDEMWKAMIKDDKYPEKYLVDVRPEDWRDVAKTGKRKSKTVTLSTDIDAAYTPDKKFNEDVTLEMDLYPDLLEGKMGLIVHILEESKQRVKGASKDKFNFVTNLARTVPVYTNELYWGILAAREGEVATIDLSKNLGSLAAKAGAHFEDAHIVAAPKGTTADQLKSQLQLPGEELVPAAFLPFLKVEPDTTTPCIDPSKDLFAVSIDPAYLKKFEIPDFQQSYLYIKACFKNFFNNVQKDPTVQVAGIVAQKLYLTYILWLVESFKSPEKEKALYSTIFKKHTGRGYQEFRKINAIVRKLRIQKADSSNPRFSSVRIAEHLFGIVVGAVAGQEEACARVMQAIINFKEGGIKSDKVSFDDFLKDCKEFVTESTSYDATAMKSDFANRRLPAFSNLVKYVLEGIRLFPQGEILLRRNITAIPIAKFASSNKEVIAPDTTLFVAHGSAMVDEANGPDVDDIVLGRGFLERKETVFQQANLGQNKDYLSYGYGRHVCQGRYISSTIIACALAAVFGEHPESHALDKDGKRVSQLASKASFLEKNSGQGFFILDKDNLYAAQLNMNLM